MEVAASSSTSPSSKPTSLIDAYVNAVRAERFPTPQIRYFTAHTVSAAPFFALLVEDKPSSDPNLKGYPDFLKVLYFQSKMILHPGALQGQSHQSLPSIASLASSGLEGFGSLFQFNKREDRGLPV